MKKIVLLLVITLSGVQAFSQVLSPEDLNKRPDIRKRIYKDDFIDYDPKLSVDSMFFNQQRNYVSYPSIREADVLWSKQIWREIEVGEKINLPLYYPFSIDNTIDDRQNLFDVIQQAYRANLIQPFEGLTDFNDGEFKEAKTINYIDSNYFAAVCEQAEKDEQGEVTGVIKKTLSKYAADNVIRYRLKEYWYFDKQRSQLMVKIIGLMPILMVPKDCNDPDGEKKIVGSAWFYFPEMRAVLANKEVYNRKNETVRLTFDDVFIKRQFSSHIIKEDNVYNRTLSQAGYVGFDQLVEADKIKEKIFNYEHDLWDF